MEFKRLENENEEQYIWRICQAKDNGLLEADWCQIADMINAEFRDDESEFRNESAYRKPYQQAKRFYEAGVFQKYIHSSYIDELRSEKHELRKEKQKLFDERVALNKILRENARTEEDLARLEKIIKESSRQTLLPVAHERPTLDNDVFICLSDFHVGMNANSAFGSYNSEIAEKRLSEYLNSILEIATLHRSENAYVALLGDLLNGEIHFTTQLQNRENVTEQIQKCGELISAFVYELSKHFDHVYVNGVAGNHSRTSFKDQVLRNNRLDNLIPWYMKAKLSHLTNVSFIDDHNYDSTIGNCDIRGNNYLLVHGDFDSFSESGVSKLVMMLGYKPCGIFFGHMHHCSYDDISGVKIVRSGSFCGTPDDYTISKRIVGKPQQMVCVINQNGIKACYPIDLK